MDTKQHSTKPPLPQVVQDKINEFKTDYEEAGGDLENLIPDDELNEVIACLYHIIVTRGWNPLDGASWIRADQVFMLMAEAKTATAGV